MKNLIILKKYCSWIYYAGTGNFWYVPDEIPDDNTFWYRSYNTSLVTWFMSMTILECLGAFLGEFPPEESIDCLTFALCHAMIMVKLLSVIWNKESIKNLNRNMVTTCEQIEDMNLMNEKYREIKVIAIFYFISVYGSCCCYLYLGVKKMLEGSHFVVIVTYYPGFENNSTLATSFRYFAIVFLFTLMFTMILSIDGLTVIHLIILKYKFITLRHYFESIKEEFDRDNVEGDKNTATDKLTNGLIEGIVMHARLISLTKEVDKCFGLIIKMQLGMTSGITVPLLLQVALSDNVDVVAVMKMFLFVGALFFLLAILLCGAGEITYQASLLVNAVFYCGWYASTPLPAPHRNVRRIVLQAIMQMQQPLHMKAFNMLELTYATFLLVVRTTYSVFALFYAKNK